MISTPSSRSGASCFADLVVKRCRLRLVDAELHDGNVGIGIDVHSTDQVP